MKTLAATKSLLNKYIKEVEALQNWFWSGTEMLEIVYIDTDKLLLVLSNQRGVHMNTAHTTLRTNVHILDKNTQKNVAALDSAINNLVKNKYDLDCGERAIKLLFEAGYNDARARKPKKTMYNFYTSRKSEKSIQSSFNTIVETGRFKPDEFEEFGAAYLEGFTKGLEDKQTAKEEKQRADRRCVDAVINSYPGDVDELIDWLRSYAAGVFIKAAREEEFTESATSEKCRVKALESIEATIEELMFENMLLDSFELERNTGMFNCWELRLKPGHKDAAPKEVFEWLYDKKVPGDIDTYEPGTVYKVKLNKLNSNPIIKDLVFNYGFKVGKY